MIIDDDLGTREILSDIFEENNYKIFTASNGAQGLTIARNFSINAALLDLKLPDMSGVEVLRGLREINQDIICCIITGYSSIANAIETLREGAIDYFEKPLVLDKVINRLTEALDRQRLIRELADSEAKFRLFAQTARDGIVTMDESGGILFINDSMKRMFGYRNQELLEKNISILIPERFRDFYPLAVKEFLETGDAQESPSDGICGLTKAGAEIPLEISFGHFKEKGKRYFSAIIRDISERKKAEAEKAHLEEQLRHAQKMEALGTLAGGIAHDFNNILTAILGYSEVVKESFPAGSQAREDMTEIISAGRRASDMVKQILAFSRQSAQKSIPIQMHLLVKEVMKLLRASIPTTITIEKHIYANAGYVIADPVQLHQIVMNLCTNAYQAMREKGGTLSVTLKAVNVGEAQAQLIAGLDPGEYTYLSVRDDGHGIDPQILPRIFDPYFTTKKTGEGTGLGLSVVHGIVSRLGGAITARSTLGEGAVFEVYLPRHVSAQETALPAQPLKGGGAEHLLLVDDESALIKLYQSNLEKLGYRVTAYTGSQEALAAFKEADGQFDILITDQTMPKMTGMELIREIRKIRPGIPAVLSTGYSDIITKEQALREGVDTFLLKPFTVNEMNFVIRSLFDKETSEAEMRNFA